MGRRRDVGRDLERLAFAAPAPLRAWVHPTPPGGTPAAARAVTVTQTQPSFRLDRARMAASGFVLPPDAARAGDGGGAVCAGGLPLELPEGALFVPLSPDAYVLGRPAAAGAAGVKGGAGTKEPAPTVWEGWEGGRLAWEFETAEHGKLVPGGWFSRGGALCPAGRRIAFVADSLPSRKRPRFQAGEGGAEGGAASAVREGWEGRGFLEQDWGEQHSERSPPAVWVLDLERREVSRVPSETSEAPSKAGASAGQPTWLSDGSLVFTVWLHSARESGSCFAGGLDRRLGAVYCLNRPCHLARSWPGEEGEWQGPVRVSPTDLKSAHSAAAVVGRGTAAPEIAFLSHGVACDTGVHAAGASLHTVRLPASPASAPEEGCTRCVVKAVDEAAVAVAAGGDKEPFYGIYASTLLAEAGSFAPGSIVLTTLHRSELRCVAIRLADGEISTVGPSGGSDGATAGRCSLQLLGCAEAVVVAARSRPDRVPELVWLEGVHDKAATWNPFVGSDSDRRPVEALQAANLLQSDVLEVEPRGGGGSFDALVLRAHAGGPDGEREGRPVLLVPHGGPHSCSPFAWNTSLAALALQGYTIVQPNFRGSLGFGNAPLLSLPGRCGTQDVGDCLAALDAALAAYPDLDSGRVALLGGSHGGFLTAHLLGQYSDRFFAGALRNPVCSLPAMVGMTDIPDWCFVECFGVAEGARRAKASPTPADLEKLYECSPIRHVAGVRAPMLFLLGSLDRRTPKADAMQYVRALEAEGRAPTPKVIDFPNDCHPLDRPRTHYESWCTIVNFLAEHLPKPAVGT